MNGTTTYLAIHGDRVGEGRGHARAGLVERIEQEVQTKPLRDTVADEGRLRIQSISTTHFGTKTHLSTLAVRRRSSLEGVCAGVRIIL